MNDAQLKKRLKRKLDSLKQKKGVYLFISPAKQYKLFNTYILNHYTKESAGIYVTLNKGYKFIINDLKEIKNNASNLHFIDAVTGQREEKNVDNCTFISNPQALTELALAISAATSTGKFGFLFLDSINTLLIYNNFKTTERFTHYVISKLRETKVGGIVFSIDEESANKIIPVIRQFCDESIGIENL